MRYVGGMRQTVRSNFPVSPIPLTSKEISTFIPWVPWNKNFYCENEIKKKSFCIIRELLLKHV